MRGKIYKITNLINGNIYIGQTIQTLKQRREVHKGGYYPNMPISRAIQKYGEESFSWEIIEDKIRNQRKLDKREIFWIKHYNSFSNGYNATLGGNGGGNYLSRKAIVRNDGKIFESGWKARIKIGQGVINVLRGKARTCGGYGFRYLEDWDGKPWEVPTKGVRGRNK